jgi:hypothetical protein
MSRRHRYAAGAAIWFLATLPRSHPSPEAAEAPAPHRFPVAFEQNSGQFDPAIAFTLKAPHGGLWLSAADAVFSFPGKSFRMTWVGGRPSEPVGVDRLRATTSYFLGNRPAAWRTQVPNYGSVAYSSVWPGIDLQFRLVPAGVEYDFLVAPDAQAAAIRLRFDGAQPHIDPDGALTLAAGGTELAHRPPRAFQALPGGSSQEVPVRYVRLTATDVGFEVGPRAAGAPLVIDPALVSSTFLGGSGEDLGAGVAHDAAGNIYVVGSTSSADFPLVVPLQATNRGSPDGGHNVFVTKLDPTGSTLLYSTYLGGTTDDYAQGVAVDSSGSAFVVGGTYSTDFPTQAAVQTTFGGVEDAFAVQIDPGGSTLVYSTYLGGTLHDRGIGVAAMDDGEAFFVGETSSADFPTANAQQPANAGGSDVFVTHLSAAGSLLFSTYLGGSNDDYGYTVATDPLGNAYVAGFTSGPNFPTLNAIQPGYASAGDAFVSGYGPGGQLRFSTYWGGSGSDFAQALALDSAGNVFMAGYTNSSDFPVENAVQSTFGGVQDAFVTQFSDGGAALAFSTYLGGSGDDRAFGVGVGGDGSVYVTGYTASANFPTTPDAFQPSGSGSQDAFISALSPLGSSLGYSTYFGGNAQQSGVALTVAQGLVVVGSTSSADFPTVHALQPVFGGGAQDTWFAIFGTPQPDGGQDGGAAAGPDGGVVDGGALAWKLVVGCG